MPGHQTPSWVETGSLPTHPMATPHIYCRKKGVRGVQRRRHHAYLSGMGLVHRPYLMSVRAELAHLTHALIPLVV